jgi:S-adenosylmethionine hydrolase
MSSSHKTLAPGYPAGIITLLTDFGLADAYVGTMKGVIASINPRALVIDLCHEIAPQDVRGAAFELAGSFQYFPERTIHVAVVDPTVGSDRPALCVESAGHYFIGPDNGVLSLACYRAGRPRIYRLENERYMLESRSRTFHGRDVFAPAAAHLAAGAPIETVGPRTRSMQRIRIPKASAERGTRVGGRIVYVDRFGNLTTNIGLDDIRRAFPRTRLEKLVVSVRDDRIRGISTTYSSVRPGSALALFASHNLMEIAVRDGDAASQLGVERGEQIVITRGGRSRASGGGR